MELPLWLAEILAVSQAQSGTPTLILEMPKALGKQHMNALIADPKSINIRDFAQHFYALGARMLELFEDDAISDVLNDVCSCLRS